MSTVTCSEQGPILVEFTSTPHVPHVRRVGLSPADLAEKSAKAIDKALQTLEELTRRTHATIDKLASRPSKVELAFGLSLDAELGALVTKVGGEANINVKLTWDRAAEKLQAPSTVA